MSQQRRHDLGTPAGTGALPSLAFSLERLPGSTFGRRFLEPDGSGEDAGGDMTPKGVPLPGLLAARQEFGL